MSQVNVVHTDEAIELRLVAGERGPTGPQGSTGATGDPGLNWRGAWHSATTYAVNDAVSHAGASYRRLIAGATGTAPNLDSTNWVILAAKGEQGPTGPSGADGPAGPQGISGDARKIALLRIFGHSYAHGVIGPSSIPQRLTSRVAAALGAREKNAGVSGDAATIRIPGFGIFGLSGLLQALPSPTPLVAPYETGPEGSIFMLYWGTNDAPALGQTNKPAFINAMKTAISNCLSNGAIFENDHASVGPGGTNVAKTDRNGGSSTREVTANGTSIAVNVPNDVPSGRTGWFSFVIDNNTEATVTISRNGGAGVPVSLNALTQIHPSGYSNSKTYRTPIAAGDTFTLTFSGIVGKAQFDRWGIEAATERSPLVVIPSLSRVPNYSVWGGAADDALFVSYNAALAALASEYPAETVIVADCDTVLGPADPAYFISDGVHPNDTGNAKIAGAILDALPDFSAERRAAINASHQGIWQSPTLNSGYSSYTALGQSAVAYRKLPNGKVELRGGVQKTSGAWVQGDIIFTLPARFVPEGWIYVVVPHGDTAVGFTNLGIAPQGWVMHLSSPVGGNPDVNAWISLDNISFDSIL